MPVEKERRRDRAVRKARRASACHRRHGAVGFDASNAEVACVVDVHMIPLRRSFDAANEAIPVAEIPS